MNSRTGKDLNLHSPETGERALELPLAELHPFRNHPFKVSDDERMAEMAESIRLYGVLVPAIARPRPEGGYELIAGHRRKYASELAERNTMPVIVRDLDDDAATIIMVDSNLQRESLLPSEKAFAYKMKLEAMKRQSGRPRRENLSQAGTQKRSDQQMAEQTGESRNQIQRYIRLTELIPGLLELVDARRIAFNPAVELSYLGRDQQRLVLQAIQIQQRTPSLSQALRMKKSCRAGKLSGDAIFAILAEEKRDTGGITLPGEKLRKYFPESCTPRQMEETIFRLLEAWRRGGRSGGE